MVSRATTSMPHAHFLPSACSTTPMSTCVLTLASLSSSHPSSASGEQRTVCAFFCLSSSSVSPGLGLGLG